MKWQRYIKANIIVFTLMVLAFLLKYLLNLVLASYFPAHLYGDYALTLRVIIFLVPLLLLGTQKSTNRFLSKYLYTQEVNKFVGFYRWSYRILIYATVITILLQLLSLVFVLVRSKLHLGQLNEYHLIFYSLWIIPIISLCTLQSSILQAMKHYTFSMLSSLLYPIIMYITLMIIFTITGQLTLIHALLCLAFSFLTIVIIQRIIIYSMLKQDLGFRRSVISDESEKDNWLSISISLMFNTFLFIGLGLVNMMILELIGKNEAEVGYFAAILTISSMLMLVTNAANYILNPKIILYLKFKKKSGLQKLIALVTKVKAIPGIILLLLIVIFGKNLLGHFGSEYIQGYHALLMVSIALFVNLVLGSAEALLIYANQQKVINRILFLELCFNIILSFILIPKFNINGAALAMCISITFSSVISAVFAFKKLKIKLL